MNRNKWLWTIVLILTGAVIWNYPVTYHIGINGIAHEKKIPIYAKLCGFLYRDWMYKDIVFDATRDSKDKEIEKVLGILRWTTENIKGSIPPGLKAMDDHPLNIIIRQYAAREQIDDIFTILCSYAGFRSGTKKCYTSDKTRHIILSFVKVSGRWLIFDASRNRYFLNRENKIGSVEDYLRGDLILPDKEKEEYKEFLDDLKNIDFSSFTRPEEQMPIRRVMIEVERIFRPDKRPKDDIKERCMAGRKIN